MGTLFSLKEKKKKENKKYIKLRKMGFSSPELIEQSAAILTESKNDWLGDDKKIRSLQRPPKII